MKNVIQKKYIYFAVLLCTFIIPLSCLANDYACAINTKVMKTWQWDTEGRGACTYAIFKIESSGKLSKILLHAVGDFGSPAETLAEKQIEAVIRRCEPFPAPPPEEIAKPWALLVFYNHPGHETLSGPMFKGQLASQIEAMQDYIQIDRDNQTK